MISTIVHDVNARATGEAVPLNVIAHHPINLLGKVPFYFTSHRTSQIPTQKIHHHVRTPKIIIVIIITTKPTKRNRALSIRSRRDQNHGRHRFGISTLRGNMAPELSRKMGRLVKSENTAIGAYEAAGRERTSIAAQLSDWGEATDDDAISDISDKLGVMMAEMGEQEDVFAANLEDYRGVLKHIRNMESSVQPSRDQRQKVTDEIAKLKYKDPTSTRLVTLEHELVRAEAQNLVAEAQLSNIVRI